LNYEKINRPGKYNKRSAFAERFFYALSQPFSAKILLHLLYNYFKNKKEILNE